MADVRAFEAYFADFASQAFDGMAFEMGASPDALGVKMPMFDVESFSVRRRVPETGSFGSQVVAQAFSQIPATA